MLLIYSFKLGSVFRHRWPSECGAVAELLCCVDAGSNGRYWAVDVDDRSLTVDSEHPQAFIIELCQRSRLAIRSTVNGNYVSGEQNGCVSVKYPDIDRATLWEY